MLALRRDMSVSEPASNFARRLTRNEPYRCTFNWGCNALRGTMAHDATDLQINRGEHPLAVRILRLFAIWSDRLCWGTRAKFAVLAELIRHPWREEQSDGCLRRSGVRNGSWFFERTAAGTL